jgi:hypothetical protein
MFRYDIVTKTRSDLMCNFLYAEREIEYYPHGFNNK